MTLFPQLGPNFYSFTSQQSKTLLPYLIYAWINQLIKAKPFVIQSLPRSPGSEHSCIKDQAFDT